MALMGLLVLIAAIAAVAAGLSAGLRMWAAHWRLRTRIVIAALGGAFGPMAIPFFATLRAVNAGHAPAFSLIVVFGIALVLAIVVGLPVALVLGQRHQPKRRTMATRA